MRTIFTVASIITIAGCSLFGFDGLSGGEDPVDAGSDGTTNADSPTNGGDANVIDDAGGGGDATPSGPFCKTTGAEAGLCDDFEEPGTFTGKWPEKDSYLGKLEVVDGIGFGNGRGLRFTAAARTDGQVGQDARVILGYTTSNVVNEVDCEIAVKPTMLPTGTYMAGPMHVQFERAAGGRQAIGFYFDSDRTLAVNPIVFGPSGEVIWGGGGTNVATLPANAWSRLRIVAKVGAVPSTVRITSAFAVVKCTVPVS